MSEPVSVWTIGTTTITRVDEIALEGQGAWLLPAATPDLIAGHPWLDPSSMDDEGGIRLSVHSFVIDAAGARIVVDTGVGNGKIRDNPAWHDLDSDYLHRLGASGIEPESVDIVVNTHLHRDHVGWNTTLCRDTWRPTFSGARYLVSRAEWEYWRGASLNDDQRRMFADSITPVLEAGQVDIVDVPGEIAIAEGVTLVPTPGHTPGHLSVRVESEGRTALISGDFVHHPVQIARADLCCGADVDPVAAEHTRRRVLDSVTDEEILFLGSHFTHPTAGYVRSTAAGRVFEPALFRP